MVSELTEQPSLLSCELFFRVLGLSLTEASGILELGHVLVFVQLIFGPHYESAEQKPKHCLTPGFLIPLLINHLLLPLNNNRTSGPIRKLETNQRWHVLFHLSFSAFRCMVVIKLRPNPQVNRFPGCCTADSQTNKDQNQLNNNLKLPNLRIWPCPGCYVVRREFVGDPRGKLNRIPISAGAVLHAVSPCRLSPLIIIRQPAAI